MNKGTSNFRPIVVSLLIAFILPLFDLVLPPELRITDSLRGILLYTFLALGVHVITGLVGLLNLGSAAFMAIGAYTFGVLTCPIYPFQFPFALGLICAILMGTFWGLLLGLPAIRLRGDYLAIVTLGFGEIVQDILRNLDVVTKGTQGLTPLAQPELFGLRLDNSSSVGWYYMLLCFLALVTALLFNLERSQYGRMLVAVRDDELAAASIGIPVIKIKLGACATAGALGALAGGLAAAYFSSTGEPGNYDFNLSIIAICMVIVGGLGKLWGALLGGLVMMGINSIFISKLTQILSSYGITQSGNVLVNPNNWKYMLYGLALVLVMRLAPSGIAATSKKHIAK